MPEMPNENHNIKSLKIGQFSKMGKLNSLLFLERFFVTAMKSA